MQDYLQKLKIILFAFPNEIPSANTEKTKKNKILPEHECFQSASFLFSSHSLLSRNNLLTRSLILLLLKLSIVNFE